MSPATASSHASKDARAVRCACAVTESMRELGLEIRAGLHTGECELINGKVGGIAVHIGARIAKHSEPGEVLVSSTVKDLVAGSGLRFRERGSVELKALLRNGGCTPLSGRPIGFDRTDRKDGSSALGQGQANPWPVSKTPARPLPIRSANESNRSRSCENRRRQLSMRAA